MCARGCAPFFSPREIVSGHSKDWSCLGLLYLGAMRAARGLAQNKKGTVAPIIFFLSLFLSLPFH